MLPWASEFCLFLFFFLHVTYHFKRVDDHVSHLLPVFMVLSKIYFYATSCWNLLNHSFAQTCPVDSVMHRLCLYPSICTMNFKSSRILYSIARRKKRKNKSKRSLLLVKILLYCLSLTLNIAFYHTYYSYFSKDS